MNKVPLPAEMFWKMRGDQVFELRPLLISLEEVVFIKLKGNQNANQNT
jgi:hypothetical protein